MFYSPLRYPGGKNKIAVFLAKLCADNNIRSHYVEPYAGGSSVALFLLFEGYINRITINDKDRSIYAFWHSVLYNTEALCDLITNTEITLENWNIQKEVQNNKETATLLSLGFSTLFLNRTNRSGIIKGGMIGGREQTGDYKLDCRFNKEVIIQKINAIAAKEERITLHSLDALDLIDLIVSEHQENDSTIFYFDPPYYLKASSLYMNYYNEEDHEEVANKIKAIRNVHWIVSYDNHTAIKNLYHPHQNKEYCYNHSAHSTREGKEILFFSDNIIQPNIDEWNPIDFKMSRSKNGKKIVFKPKTKTSENQPLTLAI
jgi:DNA adenine methylase